MNEIIIRYPCSHTETIVTLPSLHQDPFDRMLVAQALSEPMQLLREINN